MGKDERHSPFQGLAVAGFVAVLLLLFWTRLELRDLQAYVIPVGAGVLVLLHLYHDRVAVATRNAIRALVLAVLLASSGLQVLTRAHPGLGLHLSLLQLGTRPPQQRGAVRFGQDHELRAETQPLRVLPQQHGAKRMERLDGHPLGALSIQQTSQPFDHFPCGLVGKRDRQDVLRRDRAPVGHMRGIDAERDRPLRPRPSGGSSSGVRLLGHVEKSPDRFGTHGHVRLGHAPLPRDNCWIFKRK